MLGKTGGFVECRGVSGKKVPQELVGLEVHVDDVMYMPSLEAPADKPHPFVYFLTIRNRSSVRVTIRGRKWVVRDDTGEVTVVEGDGVVGQMPVLGPNEDFSYNSYHVMAGNGTAEGAFFGHTDDGDWVFTRIPSFRLEVPDWV
jgi:ApaG protein